MLRVGIDARLISYRRGMGTYVYHLLHGLARRAHDVEIVAFLDSHEATEALPRDSRVSARVLRPAAFPVWEQIALPKAARREGLDVLHCPFNTAPIAQTGVPLVLTVHDVMYMLPPSVVPRARTLYHEAGRRYRSFVVRRVAPRAEHVLTDSQMSAADIHRILGVSYDRMSVVYLGVGGEFFVSRPQDGERDAAADTALRKLGIAGPYVLALGAIDPRKNTSRLLEAFALVDAAPNESLQLVVSGLSRSGAEGFRAQATKLGIHERVLFLDFVDDETLRLLYRRALAFAYPSLYEGFGIPVIEAMASGTPVVASAIDVVKEVADNAALFVNPTSTQDIARALRQVTSDARTREEMIDKGRANVARFSWDAAVDATAAIYRRVAAAASRQR